MEKKIYIQHTHMWNEEGEKADLVAEWGGIFWYQPWATNDDLT